MVGRRVLLLLGVVATLKVLGGLWAPWTAGAAAAVPSGSLIGQLALMSSLALAGWWLAVSHGPDRRPFALAICFLLVASAFADRGLSTGRFGSAVFGDYLAVLYRTQPIAWLPAVASIFFASFPRLGAEGGGRLRNPVRIALIGVGAALFAANLVTKTPHPLVDAHTASSQAVGLFWPFVLVPAGIELGLAAWRSRRAPAAERRRVQWMIASLLAGSLPLTLVVILGELAPRWGSLLARPGLFGPIQASLFAVFMLAPAGTLYAVRVHRALDVRLAVRRAIQYALARFTLLMLVAAPAVGFMWIMFVNRRASVGELLSGGPVPWMALLGVSSAILVRRRGQLLAAIDRRFFREQYDARAVLEQAASVVASARSLPQLEVVSTTEIDRALHVEPIALLTIDDRIQELRSAGQASHRLASTSDLAGALRSGVPIDLIPGASGLATRDDDSRGSLLTSGFRMLIPLLDRGGQLVGVLALGEKRSELPYTSEDRSLLISLGLTLAATIERLTERQPGEPAAKICRGCRKVAEEDRGECPSCGGDLGDAVVPRLIAGKYQVVELIGSGGMGVVFRAVDRSLDRQVAIKTLAALARPLAWRLRREAWAMAAVSHPNLATLFGLESWRGNPLLVTEYLPNGTLADRINRGRLGTGEVLALGSPLAAALQCLHGAGLLHRDVKPSNVGFAADGGPKLLDFGLARLIEESSDQHDRPRNLSDRTSSGVVVGTIAYLSPEAAGGETPDPYFDLWGLAVTLLEALTGTNPFLKSSALGTLSHLAGLSPAIIAKHLENAEPVVVSLFQQLLHPDRSKRPPTAEAFASLLREAQTQLACESNPAKNS